MKNFLLYIFFFATCALMSIDVKAQALISEEVTIQRQMEAVEAIASRNAEEIKSETLGVELYVGKTLTHSKEWNVNGENVVISVEKV